MVQIIRLFFVVFFLHFSFFIFHLSFAEEVPRFYGEEVVVTASRMPQLVNKSPWNTSVITSQEVKNFKTVGEALRIVAGADLQSYGYLGTLSSLRLRGSNPSRVTILVDGRRVNSPLNGEFDLNDLLTDNVERIEVVRGPVSALYGSDAIAGVVNIITKTPAETKKSFSVSMGSFGTQKYIVSVANDNYSISMDYLKSEGFRTNSNYSAKNFTGKLSFPLGNWFLGMDAIYYDAVKGLPNVPALENDPTSASTPNDRQTDKNLLASLCLKSENANLRIYHNVLDQKVDPYVWGASINQSWQTGLEWQQNFDLGMGKVLYGLEAREDNGKSSLGAYHNTIRNYAVYLQDEFQLNDKCLVSAGVRGDKHSAAGTSINPRVGLVYQPSRDLIVRASAGSAFRAPSFNNLYWVGSGNPDLKPEKATSYDLGLERRFSQDFYSRINYYTSTSTDLIIWDSSARAMRNVGEATQDGIEFELVVKLGERGKGFINFTCQKATDKSAGKHLPYISQNKLNTGVFLGDGGLLVRHVGERYTDLTNTTKLPPYTVADLKFSKKVKDFTLEFAIDNLLDENYSEVVGDDPINWPPSFVNRKYPMPGRRYTLGVKWEM
ncbi:MAG: TonB-dependent receptor plug domain-containing protein [Candidatus Margulisiibacteriota bacterium]